MGSNYTKKNSPVEDVSTALTAMAILYGGDK
jgi:hypothetical protein